MRNIFGKNKKNPKESIAKGGLFSSNKLTDYVGQDRGLIYHVDEIEQFKDKFDNSTHPGARIINDLLSDLHRFHYESQSTLNDERAAIDLLNQMSNAINSFEGASREIKKTLQKEDNPQAFDSALDFCKNYLSKHLEKLKRDDPKNILYEVYMRDNNKLKTSLLK